MKQLILVLAACAALISCKKETNKGRLDPNAQIALNPAPGTKAYDPENPEHLTAKQITERATIISFWNDDVTTAMASEREFTPEQRDLTNNRLMMWGTDIVSVQGELETVFLEGRDFLLEEWTDRGLPTFKKDTIAYIPNAVIRAAEQKIKAAYYAEDYATCYKVMNEAFTYTPITAEEWRELKAAGQN